MRLGASSEAVERLANLGAQPNQRHLACNALAQWHVVGGPDDNLD